MTSRGPVDVKTLQFVPLSEVKATLSERVRGLRANEQRVVITVAGRPAAVLIAFDELVQRSGEEPTKVTRIEDWRTERRAQERVRDSLLSRFDLKKLSRKGQKRYKREAVSGRGR